MLLLALFVRASSKSRETSFTARDRLEVSSSESVQLSLHHALFLMYLLIKRLAVDWLIPIRLATARLDLCFA